MMNRASRGDIGWGQAGLHLAGALAELVLGQRYLFGHLGARLALQDFLQLRVQLFFLLELQVLLHDLRSSEPEMCGHQARAGGAGMGSLQS